MPDRQTFVEIGVSPASSIRAVTPDDDNDLTLGACRALWCTVAGDLALIAVQDTAALTIPVEVGLVPIATRRVLATATTATVVALY